MPRLPFSGSEVSKAPSYLKYGNYITSTENGPPSELTTDTFHDKSMDFHRRRSRQVLNAGGSPVGRKGWSHRGLLYGSAFRTWVVQGQFVVAYVPE